MTAQPDMYDESDVFTIPAPAVEERDPSNDHPLFRLPEDDHVLQGTRPKLKVLLNLMGVMSDDSNPLVQAQSLDVFLDRVLEADSATYVRHRLEDETDDLDLDHPYFIAMFQTLIGLWYEGPTGRVAGSRNSRPPTGKRSTVRKPSKGSTRSR